MRRQRNLLGPQGMGGMVGLWGKNSFIRSTQSADVALTNSVASTTGSITPVNTSNAYISWNASYGNQNTGNPPSSTFNIIELTNATTVTTSRGSGSGANTLYCYYQVFEYEPGIIKSMQSGTIAMGSGVDNASATITSVVANKSLLVFRGWHTNDTATGATPWDFQMWGTRIQLVNSTTVTVSRYTNNTATVTAGYTVVEFF